MLVQSRFSGGSVLIDLCDFRSVLFLKLQFSEALCGNVSDVHSQV